MQLRCFSVYTWALWGTVAQLFFPSQHEASENSGADEERLSAGDPIRIATNVESLYSRIGTKKSCGNPWSVESALGRFLCSIVFRSEAK